MSTKKVNPFYIAQQDDNDGWDDWDDDDVEEQLALVDQEYGVPHAAAATAASMSSTRR